MPVLYVVDRGRGDPVLLVHGQPGLGRDWDAVAARLADHRLLIVDRPGYGRSGDSTLSIAGNAELLAELLADRRAAPAVVVGHSYGGAIAVLLASRWPELVSGLVLVGSTGIAGSLTPVDRAMAAPWAGEAMSAVGLFALGRVLPRLRHAAEHHAGRTDKTSTALQWLRTSLPDESYGLVSSQPGRRLWRSFAAEQRALLREIATVEASLPGLRVPTVVLGGTWDVVVPPSVSARIAELVPGSELVSVPRVGHFVPRDAPEVVADAVRRVGARARLLRGVDEQDTGT